MSTFCHGVASAQSLDKSGEIVDIKGLDITSLPRTGILNYEHKSDLPGQICGKILTAKKIFSEKDCSNEHEIYFWNKCKTPFVYITAELLDDYCQSGKDAAGILRYDHDKKGQNSHAILGFSVEGSEIPNTRVNKMLITRSIARKVTLTAGPCNSQCVAELLVDSPKSQVADDFDSIFKSSEEAVTLFKSGEGEKIYEEFLAKKEDISPMGKKIGQTKSGKDVHSHGKVGEYGFNPAEHKEASEFHRQAAIKADDAAVADNHLERMKLHNSAAITGDRVRQRKDNQLATKKDNALRAGKKAMKKSESCELHKAQASGSSIGSTRWNGKSVQGKQGKEIHLQHPTHGLVTVMHNPETKNFEVKHSGTYAGFGGKKGVFNNAQEAMGHAKGYMQALDSGKTLAPKMHNIPSAQMSSMNSVTATASLKKAIEAGSYNAAPGTLVNGAAYQTESMGSASATTGAEDNKFHATKKKDWNKRAKDDYDRWPHKEKFEKFMSARMPHLAMGEIRAIGRTIALKKSIESEKALENLPGIEKSWKHVAAGAATLAALAGGAKPANAANMKPDSTKYTSMNIGHGATPSSKATLNQRKFGPYTVTTSLHPTSTIENGVERKTSSLTHQVTVNGPHSPEHAKAVAHEIGEKDHSGILGMKPGTEYISSGAKHSTKF